MLTRLRTLLRSEDGATLPEALIGVVVVVTTITALATSSAITLNAVYSMVEHGDRVNYLQTRAAQLSLNPAAVPLTPATATEEVAGTDTKVTIWREDRADGIAIVHAATAGNHETDGSQCTNPAQPGPGCVAVAVPATVGRAGIQTTAAPATLAAPAVATPAGAARTPGQVGSFTVPAGVTELRYVVKVAAVSGPGALTFAAGGPPLEQAWIDETTTGYVYGSVPVTAGTVTLTLDGANATLANLYVYEAPR